MRHVFAAMGVLAVAACATAPAFAPVTDSAALDRGRVAYQTRCMGCHEPATPGAPDRAALAAMAPGDIYSALTVGKMKLMAIDLPDVEAREIASYLGKR